MGKYLNKKRKFKINLKNHGFNYKKDLTKNIFIHYNKKKHIIHTGILRRNTYLTYFFGNNISYVLKNSNKVRYINMPLVATCNTNVKKSCIVFGNCDKKNYLLMKINTKKLSKNQKIVLNYLFDVIRINRTYFINFGSIKDIPEILSNLNKFLIKVKHIKSSINVLKLKSVVIPDDFNDNPIYLSNMKSNIEKKKTKKKKNNVNSCLCCGNPFTRHYLNRWELKNLIDNKKIPFCENCFSKILIAYFQKKIPKSYTNKSYLILNAKNKDIINFYIKLAETKCMIENGFEIKFNKNLYNYQKYFKYIPNSLRIKKLPNGKKSISETINNLDNKTLQNYVLSNEFKEVLYKYNLSDDIGWKIRKDIINNAKLGKINNFTNMEKIIEGYIFHEYNKINSISLDNSNQNCIICGENISDSYINNPNLHRIIAQDSKKFNNHNLYRNIGHTEKYCVNCLSKVLFEYFRLMIMNKKYINKSYLIYSSENKCLIEFYIKLAETMGGIDKNNEIYFIKHFNEFNNIITIPAHLKIKNLPEGKKGIDKIINIIDNETLYQSYISNNFKKLLSDNYLSENDGWKIRKTLFDLAINGQLKPSYKDVNSKIELLISKRSKKIDEYNIFRVIAKFNDLVFNNDGNFNEKFIYKLKNNFLSESSGWNIVNCIKKEIENLILTDEDNIEIRINELINQQKIMNG